MTHTTHTQAQRLKALGFDKPTRDYFIDDRRFFEDIRRIDGVLTNNWNLYPRRTSAPTPYEVLDWLREKKGIHGWIEPFLAHLFNRWTYCIALQNVGYANLGSGIYPTHPEALSALIDKLIEILEEQKA